MTTPAGIPPSEPSAKAAPKGLLEILQGTVQPFISTLEVLRAPDPLDAAKKAMHAWHGMFAALGLLMALSMLLILAADGAPYVYPWDAIWTYKFAFFVTPSKDWNVLIPCALFALAALGIAAFGSWLVGLQLRGMTGAATKDVQILVEYTAIGAAATFVMMLLLASAIGWILFAFGVRIYVFGSLALAGLLSIPLTAWQIRKIFQRTTLSGTSGWLSPIAISAVTILTSMLAAIFVMNWLAEGFSTRGKTVNSIRNGPTVTVVQACSPAANDIVCAVTLFPGKWQDYELIGAWRLGRLTNSGRNLLTHVSWHPANATNLAFPLVKLESNKDMTIEIRIGASLVCTSPGTSIVGDDQYFAVQGRVLGERRNVPQQMLLRVDNARGAFAEMLKQACFPKTGG